MPDDNIELDSLDTQDPPQSHQPPEDDSPSTPPVSPSLTAEQLQAAIAGGNQQVLDALQNLASAMSAQREPEQPPVEPSELAERLLTDPDTVLNERVDKRVQEVLKSQVAPPMAAAMEADRDERIEARAAEIDLDWGDGFFDEHIRPRLVGPEGNLAAWSIDKQAHPKVIDAAINAILGNDFRDTERRAVLRKALADTEKAKQEREVRDAPHLMGPGRPMRGRPDKLTPDMQDALGAFNDVGAGLTENDIKATLSRENTLEAYRAAKGA